MGVFCLLFMVCYWLFGGLYCCYLQLGLYVGGLPLCWLFCLWFGLDAVGWLFVACVFVEWFVV